MQSFIIKTHPMTMREFLLSLIYLCVAAVAKKSQFEPIALLMRKIYKRVEYWKRQETQLILANNKKCILSDSPLIILMIVFFCSSWTLF